MGELGEPQREFLRASEGVGRALRGPRRPGRGLAGLKQERGQNKDGPGNLKCELKGKRAFRGNAEGRQRRGRVLAERNL